MKFRLLAPAAALLILTGCVAPAGVEAGDGPAVEPTTSASYDGPVEGEPSDEAQEPAESAVKTANFTEKVVYPDGLEVEVTKIRLGKLSASDVEYVDDLKAGTPYAVLTVRVKNGSSEKVDLATSVAVTYGPDGESADSTYVLDEEESITGALLPGKAKSGGFTFLIPAKYQDDVVAEVKTDYVHDAAVFAGSLK